VEDYDYTETEEQDANFNYCGALGPIGEIE
jgi:hypothetical protein